MIESDNNKRVIITGASGWLGRVLGSKLLNEGFEVIGVSRSATNINATRYLSNQSFLDDFSIRPDDVIVHTAFCRKSIGSQLVDSLQYSAKVYGKAKVTSTPVINISSQSVYGSKRGLTADETQHLDPEYLYAFAKAASEILLDQMTESQREFCATSLRLASLMGASQGQSPTNVISKFINRALAGEDLVIVGGGQMFSFLDVEDAADAIALLIDKDPHEWKPAYAITPDKQVNIIEVANTVADSVAAFTGRQPVSVHIEPSDDALNAGGCNALAKRDLGWAPRTSFREIVDKMVAFNADNKANTK